MSAPTDPVTGLDFFIDLVEEEFLRTYNGGTANTTGKESHSYCFPEIVRNELVSRCMDAWLVMETSLRTHFNKAAANLSKQDEHRDERTNRRTGGDVKRERRQSSMKNGACGLQPPKRVITAYFQFCREQRPRVTQEMHNRNLSMSLIDVTRELAKRWNEMPAEQRARFEQLAAQDKRRYDEQMAEFRRQRVNCGGGGGGEDDDDEDEHGGGDGGRGGGYFDRNTDLELGENTSEEEKDEQEKADEGEEGENGGPLWTAMKKSVSEQSNSREQSDDCDEEKEQDDDAEGELDNYHDNGNERDDDDDDDERDDGNGYDGYDCVGDCVEDKEDGTTRSGSLSEIARASPRIFVDSDDGDDVDDRDLHNDNNNITDRYNKKDTEAVLKKDDENRYEIDHQDKSVVDNVNRNEAGDET
ncbi:nucleolar transcription factor 1-like [Varroa jacobsoni]|uniref:nucleolar transcription factor 1-like n=1 Tax=Varroa jacobsoni TaxID=62625 RepID=UPI000BF578F4|nr:nucleolar transcription factor 1-like [Varroa jacobsoni]